MITSKIRNLAFCSMIGILGPYSAMAQPAMHFTIPFDFTVGVKSLPAGNYTVADIGPGVISIRAEGGNGAVTIAQRDEPGKLPGYCTMSFHQYGGRYFLAGVSDHGHGLLVKAGPAERELMAKHPSPETLGVIASSQK